MAGFSFRNLSGSGQFRFSHGQPEVISQNGTDDNDASDDGKAGDRLPIKRGNEERVQDRLQACDQAGGDRGSIPDPDRQKDVCSSNLNGAERRDGSNDRQRKICFPETERREQDSGGQLAQEAGGDRIRVFAGVHHEHPCITDA